ncbi:hypothetical protein GALMADRAFT_232584 [Galerina marginata CBS 339.88]|uniref:Uncharacterized protein n=1 Tax=Galerina marginata (strain CBS 339.88) TaxID=685588 RepID=A0A067SHX2_GALM3|nr:hypothetical protein GALMADRAFT_232584 [Galerina marginata CBS 339.88]
MHELLLAYGQTHIPSSPPISISAIDLHQILAGSFSCHHLLDEHHTSNRLRTLAFYQQGEPHGTRTPRMNSDLRLDGRTLWTAVGLPCEICLRPKRRVSGLVPRSSPNLLQVRPYLHSVLPVTPNDDDLLHPLANLRARTTRVPSIVSIPV